LLVPLALLDFFELVLRRRLLSLFAFSSATICLINDPLSTTISHIIEGDAGDLLRRGVAAGEQSSSASSKTHGKSSSSEMMKDVECASSSWLEFEEREDLRGHEGKAHDGDCERALEADGISMGAVE